MAENNDYTFIGIDGGGTHTRGILKRGGEVISTSQAGTTRIGAVGVGESCERVLNMIDDLCRKAEIESNEIDATVVGLAGVWLEEEKKRSQHLIRTLARGQDITLSDIMVTSDAEIAIEGAFEGGPGLIMIVGTGSIALGKVGRKKNLVRCGGWGIELDDEGSGAWIGKEGLTAIVRSLDGRGKKTILTDRFAEMYQNIDIKQPRTIVKAYAERSFEYHLLTPTVMKCAVEGDAVCLEIIDRASFHLMELLEAIKPNFDIQKIPVAMMGGIIDANTLLADKLRERINNHKKFKLIAPKGTPLDGAISIAQQRLEASL